MLALLIGSLFMWQAREAGTLTAAAESRYFLKLFTSYVGPPFAVFFLFLSLLPIFYGGKAVRIDREGITDRSSMGGGFGLIRWSEIAKLEFHQPRSKRPELWIYLENPARTMARFNPLERAYKKGWFGFARGIVGLALRDLNTSPEKIARVIAEAGSMEIHDRDPGPS